MFYKKKSKNSKKNKNKEKPLSPIIKTYTENLHSNNNKICGKEVEELMLNFPKSLVNCFINEDFTKRSKRRPKPMASYNLRSTQAQEVKKPQTENFFSFSFTNNRRDKEMKKSLKTVKRSKSNNYKKLQKILNHNKERKTYFMKRMESKKGKLFFKIAQSLKKEKEYESKTNQRYNKKNNSRIFKKSSKVKNRIGSVRVRKNMNLKDFNKENSLNFRLGEDYISNSANQSKINELKKNDNKNSPFLALLNFNKYFNKVNISKLKFSGSGPCSRQSCTLSLVGNKLYLYGGFCQESFENVWQFSLKKYIWKKFEAKGEKYHRHSHSAVTFHKKIYIIGGQVGSAFSSTKELKSDVQVLNPDKKQWKTHNYLNRTITERKNHCSAMIGYSLIIIGGQNFDREQKTLKLLKDIHVLSLFDLKWREIKYYKGISPVGKIFGF